jgi:hypothetical protein
MRFGDLAFDEGFDEEFGGLIGLEVIEPRNPISKPDRCSIRLLAKKSGE